MKVAIKNPAPLGGSLTRWGDYHFGMSLQHALEARGIEVVQHFWPEWKRDDGEDAVLVLRGKRRWHPSPGKQSMLWIISHPATISVDELDTFDLVFSASETFRRNVAGATATPIEVMRQCTDTRLFHTQDPHPESASRAGIVFVANSRGVRREILDWAVETGMPPILIGAQWNEFGLGRLVQQDFIDNTELPELYRRSRMALNDHWGDMRYFGIISNRLFDCLACGLPVVTDGFPELVEVCGDGVEVVNDARSFWDAIWKHRTRFEETQERALRVWESIGPDHTFDARAEQIASHLGSPARRGAKVLATPGRVSLDIGWLRQLLDEVIARRPKRLPTLRVLHLCPSIEVAAYLAGLGYVHSYTAGPGEGPWQLPINMELALRFAGTFDAIVLERQDLWEQLDDGAAILESLFPLVAPGGVMAEGPDGKRSWRTAETEGAGR